MSDLFDKHYKRYDAWYDRNRFAYLSELEAVRRVIPEKGRGLEVGVGSGRFTLPLGIETGVDTSVKMVALAKKRGVDAQLASGEDLPFGDSTFDYAAVIFTLCFVRNPKRVIKEAARVLRSKGKIIVAIVDKDSSLGRSYSKKGSLFYGHARFFSVEEVTELLSAAGFGDFSYYQTLFDRPNKIKTVEKPLEGYGKGGFVVIGGIKKGKT